MFYDKVLEKCRKNKKKEYDIPMMGRESLRSTSSRIAGE
jgi:hypothetical protein